MARSSQCRRRPDPYACNWSSQPPSPQSFHPIAITSQAAASSGSPPSRRRTALSGPLKSTCFLKPCVGLARAALDAAVTFAREREAFRKPIIEFQGISFMLADMATQIDAARALTQEAGRRRDAGEPFATQAAMAKLFASDTAMRVTTDAVQVHGGYGYVEEFPVERYMREAKVLQIVEGTNQIQRLVIGRSLGRD